MSAPPAASHAGTMRHSFARMVTGAGILTTARLLGDVAGAVLFIAISRAFGVEGTGLYSYAFAVAQMAFLLVDFGFLDYTMREYASADPVQRPRILTHALALQGMILLAVAAGLWGYLVLTGASPEAAAVVGWLTAYQILGHFSRMLFVPSITAQRMLAPALAEIAYRGGGALAAVALIAGAGTRLTTTVAVLPMAAAIVTGTVAVRAWRLRGRRRTRPDGGLARRMLRASSVFAGSSLITGLLAKAGIILVQFLGGLTAAGLFATALKLVDFILAPLLFLGVAVYPRLASGYSMDRDDFARVADAYVRLSFALGALACWGLVFVVPPILPRLLGPDFIAAIPVVRLAGAMAWFLALDLASTRLLWSLRLQNYRLRLLIIGTVANVGVNLLLIPWLGAIGAMIAALLTPGLMVVLAWKPVRDQWPREAWVRLVRACRLPALAGIGAGTTAALVRAPTAVSAALSLAAFALAGIASGLFRGALRRSMPADGPAEPAPAEPADLPGPVLVVAPHQDDEVLGCGGTLARLAAGTDVHVLYATDGHRSPACPNGRPAPDADRLPAVRHAEAREAMARLGVPANRLHRLDLPDGQLAAHAPALERALRERIRAIDPRTVLVPFRYDQHPDHLAVTRATRRALDAAPGAQVLEYFVYYRFPGLADPDIRRHIAPQHLLSVSIDTERARKRAALDAYTSQVTCYLPGQSRPILAAGLLDEHCAGPELFLRADANLPHRALFRGTSWRLRLSLRYSGRVVHWKKRLLG